MIAVVLAFVLGLAGYGFVRYRFDKVPRVSVTGLTKVRSATTPYDTLVVASAPVGTAVPTTTSTAGAAPVTWPLVTVLRVAPARHEVAMLDLPSNLYLPEPSGAGSVTLASLASSDPSALVALLRADLGIEVSHYVQLDLAHLSSMVDAIGGLDLDFSAPERDLVTGLDVPVAGCQTLDGDQALAYVEASHLYYYAHGAWQFVGTSTIAPLIGEQALLAGLGRHADSVVPDIFAVNSLLGAMDNGIEIDRSFSLNTLTSFLRQFRDHRGALPIYVLPAAAGPEVSIDGRLTEVAFAETTPDHETVAHFQAVGGISAPTVATTAPVLAPTVTASQVHVQVLNGNGIDGLALSVASSLTRLGFKVSGTGNAPSFSYATSQISYAPGHLGAAELLDTDVGGGATLVPTPTLSGNALSFIFGASFTSVHAAAAIHASSVTTTAVTLQPFDPDPCG